MNGRFIVFGGLDQTGKSTQSKRLAELLKKNDIPVILTSEPKGTKFGEKISSLLLNNDLSPKTQLLLFQSAREEHINRVILPNLNKGTWVISDRFFESSFIYQGQMGLSDDLLLQSHTLFGHNEIKPYMTFLFKGKAGGRDGQDILDRFCDNNRVGLEKRMELYKQLNKDENCINIDVSNQTQEEVFNEILTNINEEIDSELENLYHDSEVGFR